MAMLETINNFFSNLDQQQFKRYLIGFFCIIGLLASFILFYYFRSIQNNKLIIGSINKKRIEVRGLLERYELVKKQQKTVDHILEKDKEFKIIDFYENSLKKLGLSTAQMQDPQPSSQDILPGYTERNLSAQLVNLNMKKIVELLNDLEQQERIYLKEIEIDRSSTKPMAINLKLIIATLDKKEEEFEG